MKQLLGLPLAAIVSALGCLLTFSVQAADAGAPPIRIILVGDSTVCDYPPAHANRGWGQFIGESFKPGEVTIINLAAPGRSTKTFISEGRWQKALAENPDYVFIQFGHNDSHASTNPEATNANTDYKEYLRRYIDEARALGATPILVTSMVRRTFDAHGKIDEHPTAPGASLNDYAVAMKEVGAEKHVSVIDLHASSLALMEKIGPAKSLTFANKKGDATHFNEKGARAMADLVIAGLPAADLKLAAHLKAP